MLKLKGLKDLADTVGRAKLSGSEIELMNLAGPRTGLEMLSRERVRMEWMKLLVAPGVVPTLTVMADAGFVTGLLASVPQVAKVARLAAIERGLGLKPDPLRRLGALALHVSDDAERLWQRLRLTNAEHERLGSMAQQWWLYRKYGLHLKDTHPVAT